LSVRDSFLLVISNSLFFISNIMLYICNIFYLKLALRNLDEFSTTTYIVTFLYNNVLSLLGRGYHDSKDHDYLFVAPV